MTNLTSSMALATDNSTKVGDQSNLLQLLGTTNEPHDNTSAANETILNKNETNNLISSSSVYR
ncbi:MAG TPA: hypothetical protein VFG45_03355 [Candidatus Nitrosocosmicus sp.]|nr:hypothetical protein [Candidatus Nitrosocosmicus sp.]